jgi:hypothetical protein
MTTLDELERLINEATPGTWSITEDGDIVCQQTVTEDGETYTESLSIATGQCSQNWGYIHWGKLEDAALIVAAINALPGLLDRVERLEAALQNIANPMNDGDEFVLRAEARAALKGT